MHSMIVNIWNIIFMSPWENSQLKCVRVRIGVFMCWLKVGVQNKALLEVYITIRFLNLILSKTILYFVSDVFKRRKKGLNHRGLSDWSFHFWRNFPLRGGLCLLTWLRNNIQHTWDWWPKSTLSVSGAFIIPFFVMLIVVGMPLLLLELGLGQKLRVGAAGAWKLVSWVDKTLELLKFLILILISLFFETLSAYNCNTGNSREIKSNNIFKSLNLRFTPVWVVLDTGPRLSLLLLVATTMSSLLGVSSTSDLHFR